MYSYQDERDDRDYIWIIDCSTRESRSEHLFRDSLDFDFDDLCIFDIRDMDRVQLTKVVVLYDNRKMRRLKG